MEYLSSPANSSKDSWSIIKGTARVSIRIIVEVFHRLVINLFDTLFGFLNWPEKKLRLRILILRKSKDHFVLSPSEIEAAIKFAKKTVKENFNVQLLPFKQEQLVGILEDIPPNEILYTKGGPAALEEEFKVTGSFFAAHLCGSFYPVTAFVVIDIAGATGCSLGPLSDYVTLNGRGAKDDSTLTHEIAHACGLWHVADRSNLLYRNMSRGDKVKWWQKNIFRSSRHITYW